QLVSGINHSRGDELAGLGVGLEGDHALAAAAVQRIIVHRRALAVAVLAHDEQRAVFFGDLHADDAVSSRQPYAADAAGETGGGTKLADLELQRLAPGADDNRRVIVAGQLGGDQLV